MSRIDEARAPRALTVTFVFGMSFWIPLIDWIPLAVGTRPPWFVLAFVQTLFPHGMGVIHALDTAVGMGTGTHHAGPVLRTHVGRC